MSTSLFPLQMTKIVYNACYGGFSLSHKAVMRYAELKGITVYSEKQTSGFYIYYTVPVDEYKNLLKKANASKDFSLVNSVYFNYMDIPRTDPDLVQVVEELKDAASGQCAKLVIRELPKGTPYRINDYDGYETIETRDCLDWLIA